MVVRLKELDPEIQDRQIAAVFRHEGGWEIYLDGPTGGSAPLWVPERFGEPRAGDRARIYGRRTIRGLDINGAEVFYRLPDGWGAGDRVFDTSSETHGTERLDR